jgi:hypothetical protein
MSRSGLGILVIGVLLIGGVGALVLREFRDPTHYGDHELSAWKKVGRRIGPGTVTVEVRRITPPLPYTILPIDQTSRETILDTWVSLQSYIVAGKDNDDLQAYLSHFSDPDAKWNELCESGLSTPAVAFHALRRANAKLEIIGIIRLFNDYLLACRFQHAQSGAYAFTYVPFVKRMSGFYFDPASTRQLLQINRILMAEGYRVITDPDAQ